MTSRTKDELFILRAYETAMQKGDIHTVLNRYEIGQLSGISAKGVDAICNLLGQANFIKKQGKIDFFLTKNGEELALRLLSE